MYWTYLKITLFGMAFLAFGLLASYWLGRIYIAPVIAGIESIKKGKAEKTSFLEIDDLIEFLSRQEAHIPAQEVAPPSTAFEAFRDNVDKFSPAECAVFNLYLEGNTAQAVANIIFISINIIKWHNRRIYTKLEISSRKELLVYAKLLKMKEKEQADEES